MEMFFELESQVNSRPGVRTVETEMTVNSRRTEDISGVMNI